MNWLEITIISILAIWFAVTFFYQFFTNNMGIYAARFDIFRLIPAFQLFSGDLRDFSLFYLDKLLDGKLSEWREIPLFIQRKWYNLFWNAESVEIEAIGSIVEDLARLSEKKQNISDRFIYRSISQFVLNQPGKEVFARQFKIEENFGDKVSKENIFCSEFHNL